MHRQFQLRRIKSCDEEKWVTDTGIVWWNEHNISWSLQAVRFCNGLWGTDYWWKHTIKNTASMKETAFNMFSFIQPPFLEEMLLLDDADGFNDRFLCPFHKEMFSWINSSCLFPHTFHHSNKSVYTLLCTIHSSPHTYIHVCVKWWCTGCIHAWSIMTNWFIDQWMKTFKRSCQQLGATQLEWQCSLSRCSLA